MNYSTSFHQNYFKEFHLIIQRNLPNNLIPFSKLLSFHQINSTLSSSLFQPSDPTPLKKLERLTPMYSTNLHNYFDDFPLINLTTYT